MKQHTEQSGLENWRKQIDAIDDRIITLLAERMEVVQQVGEYKKAKNIAPRDENRWQSLLKNLITKGQSHNLSKEIITQIYTAIHEYTVHQQVILSGPRFNRGIVEESHTTSLKKKQSGERSLHSSLGRDDKK